LNGLSSPRVVQQITGIFLPSPCPFSARGRFQSGQSVAITISHQISPAFPLFALSIPPPPFHRGADEASEFVFVAYIILFTNIAVVAGIIHTEEFSWST